MYDPTPGEKPFEKEHFCLVTIRQVPEPRLALCAGLPPGRGDAGGGGEAATFGVIAASPTGRGGAKRAGARARPLAGSIEAASAENALVNASYLSWDP